MADTTGSLLQNVRKALDALPLEDGDQGARTLALQYAKAIDTNACWECGSHAAILGSLGPKLATLLNQLGATPDARARRQTPAPRSTSTAKNVINLDSLRSAARPS